HEPPDRLIQRLAPRPQERLVAVAIADIERHGHELPRRALQLGRGDFALELCVVAPAAPGGVGRCRPARDEALLGIARARYCSRRSAKAADATEHTASRPLREVGIPPFPGTASSGGFPTDARLRCGCPRAGGAWREVLSRTALGCRSP